MSSILAPVAEFAYKGGHLDFYGAVEIDVSTGEVVWAFDSTVTDMPVANLVETPAGVKHRGFRPCSVERLEDGRTLISGFRCAVWVDEDGTVTRREDHELLNGVHEVQTTDDGTYLVTATGMDTIVEFDEGWNVEWIWHMWNHVDRDARPEGYYPDQYTNADVRDVAFHPDDRFHLNYATYTDDGLILASALNYGVFYLDPDTGEVVEEFTDLDETHNPVQLGDRVVVCESGRDRVIETDMETVTDTLFDEGLSYVKDADPLAGSDDWIVADTNNNRVLVWSRSEPRPKREFFLGTDAKPYEADYLTGENSFAD